jgi:hypothetical protein
MSSRRNPMFAGGFNDPSFAQAAASLGSLFAPPSGTDAAGFANAAKTKLETQGLQTLFDLAAKGDLRAMDPMNYALRGNAGNTFQGHGMTLTNQANIARGNQDTELLRSIVAPVAAGAFRAPLPAAVGERLGLSPAEMGAVQGTVTANEGQRVMLPGGGGTFEGRQRPLNESEFAAQQLAIRAGGGALNPATEAYVDRQVPLEVIAGADGSRFVRRQDAVGQAPGAKPGTNQQTQNYRAPNGVVGTAVLTPQGWIDSQTRQPLPQGAFTFNTTVQGNQLDTGVVRPTAANNTEGNSGEANLVVMKQLADQYRALLRANPGIIGIPGTVRGAAQDLVAVASEFQQAFGSQLSPEANVTADQVRAVASRVSPTRDPAIQQARLMVSDLAYKYAQAQNPRGEVSRQAFERALETLTGGMLRNNQSALEALDGIDQFIGRETERVRSLRNPGSLTQGGAPAPAAAPGQPVVIQTQRGAVTIERVP